MYLKEDTKSDRIGRLLRSWRNEGPSAEGLFLLLAAYTTVGRESESEHGELGALLRESASERCWADLTSWLESWPDAPANAEAFAAWLRDFEDVGLAQQALDLLEVNTEGPLSVGAAIRALSDRFRGEVSSRVDVARFAGEAEVRTKELGMPVAPWQWISGGQVGQMLGEDSAAYEDVARLWIDGDLHSADAEILSERFAGDAELRFAYRNTLVERTRELWVTRWEPRWSLDVARTEEELENAAVLLAVSLPHLADQLLVRQHAKGTWWSGPWSHGELIGFSRGTHAWRLPHVGELTTMIHVQEPSPLADRWHGVTCLRQVARGTGGNRGQEVVEALIEDLADGALGEALVQGTAAFESGSDTSWELERMVDHTLEARVEMTEALMSLSDRGFDIDSLQEALGEADRVHERHGAALQILDDEVYEQRIEGVPLDLGSWWGNRAVLDELVPTEAVTTALRDLWRSRHEEGTGAVIAFPGRRRRRPAAGSTDIETPAAEAGLALAAETKTTYRDASGETPCAWLSAGSTGAIAPGCVPLLLHDIENQKGVVAELRVSFVAGKPVSELEAWGRARPLQVEAKNAIRTAYWAAAGCTGVRAAPYGFAEHRFELVTNQPVRELDGESLGLAAAIAFASAWLRKPIRGDIAAAATVNENGLIGAVSAVTAKATELRSITSSVSVLCDERNKVEVEEAGLDALTVPRLEVALRKAGLELSGLEGSSYEPVRNRQERLGNLANRVEDGDLKRYRENATWTEIADEMRRLIVSLEKQASDSELVRWKCLAALAYMHEGRSDDAGSLLRDVKPRPELRLSHQALWDIVNVGNLTNNERRLMGMEGLTAIEQLKTDIEQLRLKDEDGLLGRCLGTLGRAYLHQRNPVRALPFLREGVAEHKRDPRMSHETARSRVYLSMALRAIEDFDDALLQLEMAERELETDTRNYSHEYERSCRVYHDYERARVLVDLERYEDAVRYATQALEECRWTWWPQLGILRTRAWAYRMNGQDREAQSDVALMHEVVKWAQGNQPALTQAIIEEAEGYPVRDGEVY